MEWSKTRRVLATLALVAFALVPVIGSVLPGDTSATLAPRTSFIVTARAGHDVKALVSAVDATITRDLAMIGSVEAHLTAAQANRLRANPDITLFPNAVVRTTSAKASAGLAPGAQRLDPEAAAAARRGPWADSHFPAQVGADELHARGITGANTTVAILDSGLWSRHPAISRDSNNQPRIIAEYNSKRALTGQDVDDGTGHGTHLASVIASSRVSRGGTPHGIAPDVRLVNIKAFDDQGYGSYGSVIQGIAWAIAHREQYNIRVLNLSISTEARSPYWADPLNRIVMMAWHAGIVVITSAGNTGPDAMSIGVPGNVPYIITVGATTDNFTPNDPVDDRLAYFTAFGPTPDRFVKPDFVAPGGHLLGIMNPSKHLLAQEHPEFATGARNMYEMSGTSQAAAVVSGVAALMIDAAPWLTPNQVKCRLMATARPATRADGSLAYSVFQQGTGLINAPDAVDSSLANCANQGLHLAADISGDAHFYGNAAVDADGNYYVAGDEAFTLTGGQAWNDSIAWNDGAPLE